MSPVGHKAVSFAAPVFLWALLGVPLVVLLHFLRTERKRRDVAALFLWREAQDMAAAQRRMSPTWLLLIQILFVTAAALALAQPRVSLSGPPDAVLVIDASASMSAVDGTGRTRLDKAVEEALAVAGQSSRVAVIRAGLGALVVHPLDDDRAGLRVALTGLVAVDRTADLERALDLAEDIAGGARIHVFTDAPVAPRTDVRVHPVGGPARNFGIVAFDVGLQEAFVAVASNASRPLEVDLALSLDGAPIASTALFVPVGGQGTVTFPLSESGIYEARLSSPADDALALDDVAYAGRSELVVVLDRRNEPMERALASLPAVRVRVTNAARTVNADVRVLTGADPDDLPAGRYILLAPPAAEPVYRIVRDVDRAHPLMRFADLRETVVGISPDWSAGPEATGWEVLARDSSLVPLIRYRQDAERQILELGFHPSQTDMVLRPAFPALIANAVRTFRGEDRLPLGSTLGPGATLAGAPVQRASQPGIYLVDGRESAVSLLSASETRLPEPPPATPAEPAAQQTASERARDFAPWLLLAALLALAAEWLLSRRTTWWALRRR